MRIGFAGLGRMGVPMARNLARAGFDLTLWNRTTDRAKTLANEIAAVVAETPADLAGQVDIVITMLSDDAASTDVHFGEYGLFSITGARTFVEMGTLSPNHIRTLARSAPPGAAVIDAPVSGATQAAKDAQLLIMAGCDEIEVQPLDPIFAAIGKQVICLGSVAAGAVMKLAVNALIHGINQGFAEAMTLAESSGIETDTAFDVIEASAAAAPMLKYRRPLYLDEAAHEVTFTISLARKDMEIVVALAAEAGVAMPLGLVTLDKLREAEAKGLGARDMAAILSYMREGNR